MIARNKQAITIDIMPQNNTLSIEQADMAGDKCNMCMGILDDLALIFWINLRFMPIFP